jgi:hypothetical protein
LAQGKVRTGFTHSFFKPLASLIESLAEFLVVDRHWLQPSDERHESEYLNEVFQRLILAFIIENRDKEFMDHPVDARLRGVERVPAVEGPLISMTIGVRRPVANKKRPSPQPPIEESSSKRPRLDAEVGHWYTPFNSCLFSMLCFQAANSNEELLHEDEEQMPSKNEEEMMREAQEEMMRRLKVTMCCVDR